MTKATTTTKALDKLGDPSLDLGVKDWEIVSSGILSIDLAARKGGIARAQLIDFYGEPGLGKTTCALTMCAERIREGEQCVYIDVEHRLYRDLKEQVIGPDTPLFRQFEPASGEAALRQLEKSCNIEGVRMIVFDSLAAVITDAEMDPESKAPAMAAREVTKTLRRILTPIYQYGSIVIVINQIRNNPMPTYGQSSKTVTGGTGIKFFASLRMNIHKAGYEKDQDEIIGQRVRIEIEKNSFGAAFGEARPVIIYGEGINRDRDVIETAKSLGMIEQSASWLTYKDGDTEIRAHGEKDLLVKLNEKLPEIRKKIREKIVQEKKKNPAPHIQVEPDAQAQEPQSQPTQ